MEATKRLVLVLLAILSTVDGFLTTPKQKAARSFLEANNMEVEPEVTRRQLLTSAVSGVLIASTVTGQPTTAHARLEGINKPELLPKEPGLNVIQTEKFLTSGQAKRMDQLLANLEHDTGYRVRVLCQAYPNTPGLAIRDYWDLGKEGQKDDKYVVLVVDQFGGKGNVLNFNVGEGVKIALPNSM